MFNIVINKIVTNYFEGMTVRESITNAVSSLNEKELFMLKAELVKRRSAR